MQYLYGTGIQKLVGFSSMNIEPERSDIIFSVLEEKNCQPQILYWVKYILGLKGERKIFPDKGKLRELVSSKPIPKELLKQFFKYKGN